MPLENLQEIGEALFIISLYGDSVAFLIMVVSILVMHFLMPNKVLNTYFKPPYFREIELVFFSGIPYAPIRTIMFMRLIANPNSGLTREITQAHQLVPIWYRFSCKVLIIFYYMFAAVILLQLISFGVLFYLHE